MSRASPYSRFWAMTTSSALPSTLDLEPRYNGAIHENATRAASKATAAEPNAILRCEPEDRVATAKEAIRATLAIGMAKGESATISMAREYVGGMIRR